MGLAKALEQNLGTVPSKFFTGLVVRGPVVDGCGAVVGSQCLLPPQSTGCLARPSPRAWCHCPIALCSPKTGKVWGRSFRTRFLKDAIHGAAQRGRCWAEDLGDALGKESTCSAWLLVFLQPFVTSARGEDELGQLQHSPAHIAG